nr:MAG: hypothetical protein [Bacteriophage sp.]
MRKAGGLAGVGEGGEGLERGEREGTLFQQNQDYQRFKTVFCRFSNKIKYDSVLKQYSIGW